METFAEEKNEKLESGEGAVEEPNQDDVQTLRDAMQALADERDQVKDQLLRTMAEFQNFRKRQDVERQRMREQVTERVVLDLLPVLDNFERTLASIERG